MKIMSMRERLMASSMICGAALSALAASPALAQADANDVAEIVVTGTRIPSPNLTSVSPVQVVSDQEFKLQGQTDTVDLLNDLPQVFQNDQVSFSSTSNPLSSPGGVATIDLRGLGPQRTLVLVDGRRLGIGDPNTGNTNPAPDINQIPAQLIDRVEVLTGGASAVYGSDAIAGVVNFVMKRNFEGVQIDAQWGVNQHKQHTELMQDLLPARRFAVPKENVWDGKSRDLSLTLGVNTEDRRGNLTAYLTYHDQDPVHKSARDFSACQLNVSAAGVPSCAGSSNSNVFYTTDGQSDAFAVVGSQFVPYDPNGATSPPPLFNSNPYEYLLHQDTRYTGGFFARYDINETFNLYSDFQFMNDRSDTVVAPSALFQGSGATSGGGFLVNCNNPLMSAQQQATFCTPAQIAAGESVDLTIGRRNVEGGGRRSFYEHQNYRLVVGTRGALADAWKYDLYGSYYYTTLYQSNENYLSIARLQNALQVTRNAAGQPVCISGAPGCVPYNIFSQGGVTPEQVAYLNSTGSAYGSVRQNVIEGSVTGDLGRYGLTSPWANDGVGIALGFQHRRDHLSFAPDQASLSGDLSGFGGASTAIDNSLRVAEAYGEVRVPLVQDRPMMHDLLFESGYRYSDYSTGIQAKTYKLGLQWAPTRDARLRLSYQSAIRAPTIIELYTPQAVTNTSQLSRDPCAPTVNPDGTTTAATATLAQCQRTGVTAAQYGNGLTTNTIVQCPAEQCAVLNGGNPDLGAEQAKTFSVGLTLTPAIAPGLVASVDYYRIKLEDTVGTIPLGIVMNNCLTTGDPTFCGLIHRAPNGTLFGTSTAGGYLTGTAINVGAGSVSGVDVQAGYSLGLDRFGMDDAGSLTFNFAGSYLLEAEVTPLRGEPTYDCAGLFGPQCQTLNPRWRHTFRVSWQTPWDVLASASWRYIGKAKLESESSEPTIGGGAPNTFIPALPERSYLDLSTIWTVNELFTVRAGVTNVLDQDPPLVPAALSGSGSPNSYTTYDLLGRRLFVGFTASF